MNLTQNRFRLKLQLALVFLLGLNVFNVHAAKLVNVSILDRDYLIVNISDGDVIHQDEINKVEQVLRYTPELNVSAAVQGSNWTITSSEDTHYGLSGQTPVSCSRKKKLSGHAELEWSGNDYRYEYTYEHWIYLQLPHSLQQGAAYQLVVGSAVNSDTSTVEFTFDQFSSLSEAIHINLTGYSPDAPHKAADLYHWKGSGGPRNYSAFEGHAVYLYNVNTSEATQVGVVEFWKPSGSDVFWTNLTGSDVWNIDFSYASTPGTYRLVVEGVGCSQDFEISDNVYLHPYAVSVLGYFYMRIGESNPRGIYPPPRTPLYIPGQAPVSTTVYLTTMQPYHSQWESFADGDKWDKPGAWDTYKKSGSPTNPNAWGGHSDAADWDRNLYHVVNIYDMLLPYLLTDGAVNDDDLGISESGNSIPDIIDEAQNEVDFWLRLRDGNGYSHGLTNPTSSNVLYQAGPTAIAAWANAANAAMLADAFRVAGVGFTTQMNTYKDAAIEAYSHAAGLVQPMLDEGLTVDDGTLRGRDLKMMAAAFLYNVTGNTVYEDVVNSESVCTSGPAVLNNTDRNQLYATAAYLITPQTVHYPSLYDTMKTQLISEAKSLEADLMNERPSRRTTYNPPAYWRTAHSVIRTLIAHAVTDSPVDKDYLRKALNLEADWGLGRNPLNMIEMTTATTILESKRSVPEAYTSGRDDGIDGVHPGHTPYMNLDDWWDGMVMAMASKLYENSYPSNVKNTWPRGETYFPSRWVFTHNEFTPRQTMRGKIALYTYLYGLAATPASGTPTLSVTIAGIAGSGGTVTSSPGDIDCGEECSDSYANGTAVTLTATPDSGSVFTGWSGSCFGTESTCEVNMTINRMVTANFEPIGHTYQLTVTLSGTGNGSVSSIPAGISCGSDCSSNFSSGATVELTPTAANGSSFTGWSGSCSGMSNCQVTMNAVKTVTAAFRSEVSSQIYIYDDALAPGWQDWSWNGEVDLSANSPVHNGAHSANITLAAWGGFSPKFVSGAIATFNYTGISFWIHGGSATKELVFSTENNGSQSNEILITAEANSWNNVTLSLEALGNPSAIDRLNFFNNSGSALSMFTLDEIRLMPKSSSAGGNSFWNLMIPTLTKARENN